MPPAASAIPPTAPSSVLDNFRAAYYVLEERVIRALQTQLGDAARLGEQRTHALSLLQTAEQVRCYC